MRSHPVIAGIIVLTLSIVGCAGEGAPGPDGPSRSLTAEEMIEMSLATWELSSPTAVGADDDSLKIGVSRWGCANGDTGEISDVEIDHGEDQITLRASVEPMYGSAYDCRGNNVVEIDVDLGEPIGDRELVDGACEHPRTEAARSCDNAVRWPAGTGG